MKIPYNVLRDKVFGCWWGKTAGGTIGAPFECYRGCLEIGFYMQEDPSGVPNDDLDIQLMILRAAEKYGKYTDSHILGEYWLNYVSTSMSEYGAGKNNLRNQIPPPLSGNFNNLNKNSCGAFIRSEIWACLCAGNPDLAVRYALEDAQVDHSCEGVYGEIFCAAVQSYAFAESDIEKILEKGLTYIPSECGISRGVRCVIESYKAGKTWKEARKAVLKTVPGSFGNIKGYYPGQTPEDDIPAAEHGYDAPSNVAIGVLGLIYGEGDFGKTLCISAGCMEDADCTAGFAGATLGIIKGYSNLPEKWIKPLGEKIVTWCLRIDSDLRLPKTVGELSERVINLIPSFLGADIVSFSAEDKNNFEISVIDRPQLLKQHIFKQIGEGDFSQLLARVPNTVRYSGILFDTYVEYENGAVMNANSSKKIKLKFYNKIWDQQWLEIQWHTEEGVTVNPNPSLWVNLDQKHGGVNVAQTEFEIVLGEIKKSKLNLSLEITSNGRYTKTFIPVVLLIN